MKCPCVDGVSLVFLVRRLALVWVPALSFLGVCQPLPTGWACDWCCSVQSQHRKWAEPPLLCGCHCPVRGGVCSPVVEVKALRIRFSQAPLPLRACPTPKEVTTDASEACVVIVNLCATCAGVCSSAQKQPKAVSLSPLSSSQSQC